MASIEIQNLTKVFQNNVTAVNDFSLRINDGEFVSLLGPSGCGKTTTLRMLAGLEEPSAGEIYLEKTVLYSSHTGAYVPPEKRNMGLVFQSYALWPHMTVWNNIAFGLDMHHVPKREQRERIEQVVALLKISGLEKRYSFQISGGQQQRVALARMLALQPNVLLLDEPLSNLDARLRIEMRTELKRLHEQLKTTTVFVTHDQLEAMTLSSRIAVMRDGHLQQFGTPMEIYRTPANLFVAEFVGSPPINVLERSRSNGLFDSVRETIVPGHGVAAGGTAAGGTAAGAPSTGSDRHRNTGGTTVHHIAFRPEAITIHSPHVSADHDTSDAWSRRATVTAILPTGPEWIVQTEIDDVQLFARLDREPTFHAGDNCTLSVARSAFHLFDEAGARVTSGESGRA